MTIMNPCRECIVKVVCSDRCPACQDFWDTRRFVSEWLVRIGWAVSGGGLLLSCIGV